jgi:hypothetical protein
MYLLPSIIIVILAGSFLEIIVFNEEVLLALCFIAFVFFAYGYLNKTVFEMFEDRASKFETDLLFAFKTKYSQIVSHSKSLLFSKNELPSNLLVFEILAVKSISVSEEFTKAKLQSATTDSLSARLNDIFILEQNLAASTKKIFLQKVLYPLIFVLGKDYMSSLKKLLVEL